MMRPTTVRRIVLGAMLATVLGMFSTSQFFSLADSIRDWKTTFYVQSEYWMDADRVFFPGERLPFTFYRETNFVGPVRVVRVLYKVSMRNGEMHRQRVADAQFYQIVWGSQYRQWFESGTVLPYDLDPGDYIFIFSSRIDLPSGRFISSTSGTPIFRVGTKMKDE